MSKPRILYIEDDSETGQLLMEELSDQGFEVDLARDGQQGFAQILRTEPDLVLCDITMPALSGPDLMEKLIELAPRCAGIPFIFLSAVADCDPILDRRRLGADRYMTKPIDFEMLGAVIRSLLGGASRERLCREPSNLTEREIETLTWAARGKTSSEIAVILDVAERTVNFHIDNAIRKLGASSRIQAAVRATKDGLIRH